MKMAVFWVAAPCSMEEVYRHFNGTHRLDSGGNKHLRNVGTLVPDYTALQLTGSQLYFLLSLRQFRRKAVKNTEAFRCCSSEF
jgi:hypothetical protein